MPAPPTASRPGQGARRLLGRSAAAAAVALGLLAAAAPAGAVVSSDLAPDSRISFGGEVDATAARGDTLYAGGQFRAVGLRTAGITPTDATTGALDRGVPELTAGAGSSNPSVDRVVADGEGGAYLLNVVNQNGGGQAPPQYGGEPVGAAWLHLDQAGQADRALTARFTTGAGDALEQAPVTAVAVAPDGTTYFAGSFTEVDGQARSGVAALGPDGALLPFDPTIGGGTVSGVVVAGDSVLLVGSQRNSGVPFASVGGQPRAGLALVAASSGAVRPWSPAGLTEADASVGSVFDGTRVYLATASTVQAVAVADAATVNDLNLRPQEGRISAIESRAGKLYVAGGFSAIGAQTAQPIRAGLAEIDADTGQATGWAPPSTRGSETVALSTDTVYAGGPSSGGGTGCGEAFSLGTAAKTAWNPRITSGGAECGGVSSLAVSGDRVWNAGASAALANALPRKGYAAIDVAKDEILPWSPQHEGEQGIQPADLALSPDGATVYIADTGMQRLNGVDRLKVAAVSATGAARSSDDVRAWDPSPHYPDPEAPRGERYSYGVRRVQPSADGRTVLLAGSFLTLDGQDRPNLAATSASTGAPTAWRPAPNGDVDALELAGDGTIYVGGPFTTLGSSGAARRYLGAFAGPTEGQPTTWDPRLAAEAVGEPPVIQDLALGDGVVYAAGNFRGQIGGQDRHGVAALNRTDGRATAWDAAVNGEVSTVSTTADGTVYLVADNNYSGGFYEGPFTKVQDQDRFGNLASISAAGVVTGWNPGNAQVGAAEFIPAGFAASTEVQEVGGLVVVPGQSNNFQGTRQQGIFSFGVATAPPVVRTPPSVTGRRVEAAKLTCAPGSYGGGSVTRSYVWLRGGDPIPGQIGSTYVVREADVGKDIACRETAENAVGPTSSTSEAVRIVASAPVSEAAPGVDPATPVVGQTVSCTEGFWSNVPLSYTYRWLRDGAAIEGQTGSTYAVGAADAGKGLACEVTASNDAGASSPVRSAVVRVSVPPVQNPPGESPNGGGGGGGGAPSGGGGTPSGGGGSTTTAPGGTTTPGGPGTSTPGASKPKLSVSSKASGAKGRRITISVSPSAAGRVAVSATTGTGKKRVTVGSGSATVKKAGAVKITIKPSSRGRKALKAGRSVKVTFKVTFTAADGSKVTSTRTIKVKIKR